jgi:hypothetical protein
MAQLKKHLLPPGGEPKGAVAETSPFAASLPSAGEFGPADLTINLKIYVGLWFAGQVISNKSYCHSIRAGIYFCLN